MGEQTITLQGVQYTVVNTELFEKMREELEDYKDAIEAMKIDKEVRAGHKEYMPASVVDAVLDGKNPVKVYREYRKMTQEELAKKAGVSVSMIRKIENGESEGSISTIKAIAKALNEDVEMFL